MIGYHRTAVEPAITNRMSELRQLPTTAANLSMGAIPTGLADEYGFIQKPVRKLRNEAELIRLRDVS